MPMPFRTPLRVRSLLPALAAVAVMSAGCDVALSGISGGEQASDTWSRSYPLSEGGRVEIGNTNGFIELTAGSGKTVEVKAVRVARASTPEAAREMLAKYGIREEITADVVKLTSERPQGGWNRGGVEVRYTVTVPASARVDLKTTNGHINVNGITAGADLGTTNGEIDGRALSGQLKASTTNGSVELEVAALTSDVSVATTNGSVDVRVPGDAKATIAASWTNGGMDVEGLTVETTERSRRRFDGRLNGGGSRIEVETTNGGITLARR